jgi:hypothetical protein
MYIDIYVCVRGFDSHTDQAETLAQNIAVEHAVVPGYVDFVRRNEGEYIGTELPDGADIDKVFGHVSDARGQNESVVYKFSAHVKAGDRLFGF